MFITIITFVVHLPCNGANVSESDLHRDGHRTFRVS